VNIQQIWDLATARCRFGKYLRVAVNGKAPDIQRLVRDFPPRTRAFGAGRAGARLGCGCWCSATATAELQLGEQAKFFPTDAALASWMAQALLADVQTLMRRRGVGTQAIDPQLYLFIASPNAVTPFHIDRYSTFLMQFRGSKEVTVFPQWDERVVPSVSREAYVAYANSRLSWSPEADALGTKFEFAPGEAIHIPFVAGHHVRNGGDDVSISMSIIFNTAQSMAWRRALSFNHASRRVLGRFGIAPSPVGRNPLRDSAKAQIWDAVAKVKSARR
jgi:hypothetical protein